MTMNYSDATRIEGKREANAFLEKLKQEEKTIKFHERRINKNTIVYCKNEERLDEYDNSYNNIKNW